MYPPGEGPREELCEKERFGGARRASDSGASPESELEQEESLAAAKAVGGVTDTHEPGDTAALGAGEERKVPLDDADKEDNEDKELKPAASVRVQPLKAEHPRDALQESPLRESPGAQDKRGRDVKLVAPPLQGDARDKGAAREKAMGRDVFVPLCRTPQSSSKSPLKGSSGSGVCSEREGGGRG